MRPPRPYICPRCCVRFKPKHFTKLRSITTSTSRHPSSDPPPTPQPTADPRSASSQTLFTLQPQTLHKYTSTSPPTPSQLRHANTFFASQPRLLWTSAHFRSFPSSPHPEVAFLGRSNVGKSSLLNALFGRTRNKTAQARVSKRPGRTKTMNAFGIGPKAEGAEGEGAGKTESWKSLGRGGVVVVDMPGYGHASQEEWGREILKYVQGRKQLRRTFLLVDAEHGLKASDVTLLQLLSEHGVSHQIILSKVDKLLFPNASPPSPQRLSKNLIHLRNVCEEIQYRLQPESGRLSRTHGDILCCSAEKEIQGVGVGRGRLGIDALRWAALSACGLDCDEAGNVKQQGSYKVLDDDDEDY